MRPSDKTRLKQLQRDLQALHEEYGAAPSQNVRNIEAAHITIVRCLPSKQGFALNGTELWQAFRKNGGLVSRNSFNVILGKMVMLGKINTIRFNNVPFAHYYFGLK